MLRIKLFFFTSTYVRHAPRSAVLKNLRNDTWLMPKKIAMMSTMTHSFLMDLKWARIAPLWIASSQTAGISATTSIMTGRLMVPYSMSLISAASFIV